MARQFVLVNKDLTSIEPIVSAWLAKDERSMDVFLRGKKNPKDPLADIYKLVGEAAFSRTLYPGIKAEQIVGPIRDQAKVVKLGNDYNRGAYALAQSLQCTEKVAADIILSFWLNSPALAKAECAIRKLVFAELPVETEYGASMTFPLTRVYDYKPKIHNKLPAYLLAQELEMTGIDAHLLRKANNFRVQGRASKVTKMILVRLWRERCYDDKLFEEVIPVKEEHDAILFQIAEDVLHQRVALLDKWFEDFNWFKQMYNWDIGFTKKENPLRSKTEVGYNQGEMVDISEWKTTRPAVLAGSYDI